MKFTLPAAFDLQRPALVALVGGGGKTSLMFALAEALAGSNKGARSEAQPQQGRHDQSKVRVVMTTTTRIFAAQMARAPAICFADELEGLGRLLAHHGRCLVVGKVRGDKAMGVSPELPSELFGEFALDFVLVEADGSRMRPIKAPASHEPVVPGQTTLLVPVVGIDALAGRIQDVAHRPERVVRLLAKSGRRLTVEDRLSAEAVATLITHSQGGLKGVADAARIIPFINKVETEAELGQARQIAGHVIALEPRIERVIIGAVKSNLPVREVYRRVTAVLLAAGEGRRMGQTKQLLPWGETTVLEQTIHNLKESAVHDIIVVSGHEAETVEGIAAAAGVKTVRNPQYQTGEMLSSLKTAVRQLPANRAAILVMLADQPMVPSETLDRLLEAFWQGQGELIAPIYEGKRGNPVLIGRTFFDELLNLPADSAPRLLLKRHKRELHLVPVENNSVLLDLDSPEDYQRWRPATQSTSGQSAEREP